MIHENFERTSIFYVNHSNFTIPNIRISQHFLRSVQTLVAASVDASDYTYNVLFIDGKFDIDRSIRISNETV